MSSHSPKLELSKFVFQLLKAATCAPQSLNLVILGALLAFKGLFKLLIVHRDFLHYLDWEIEIERVSIVQGDQL